MNFETKTTKKGTNQNLLLKTIIITLAITIITILIINIHIYRLSDPYIIATHTNNIYEYQTKADAIIVLGASAKNNIASPMLADRLNVAIKMYQASMAPQIIVSGSTNKINYDEAQTMQTYLIAQGVKQEDIIMDKAGDNTYRSFYRAKNVYKINKILIATTQYHLPRSIFLARSLGLDAYGCGSINKKSYNMPYNFIREQLAKIKAIINIYLLPPDLNQLTN